MKRKLAALLCVVSMMAAMLSGCGDSSGEKNSQESPKSAQGEVQGNTGEADGQGSSGEDLEYVELQWYVLSYQMGNITDVDMIIERYPNDFWFGYRCCKFICMMIYFYLF